MLGHSQLAVTLPKAVSADGNVVGGLDDTNMLGAPRSAFVWRDLDGTPPATLLRLASPQGTQSADSVTWLNVNGTTGVGQSGGGYLTRWTNLAAGDTPSAVYLYQDGSTGNTPGLGTMAITCFSPLASDDANLIVGDDWDGAPFTWTAAHGRVALARENTWAFAQVKALTPDGQRAVGMAYLGANTESSSYLIAWTIDPGTQASTAQVLAGPFPPVPDLSIGSRTAPVAISTDRSIIVYNQPLGAGLGTAPMVRLAGGTLGTADLTGSGRLVGLVEYLSSRGVTLTSIDEAADGALGLVDVVSVSGDGRTFCGNGVIVVNDPDLGMIDKYVVWTARVPGGAGCNAADVAGLGGAAGGDGQLTADDLIFYLGRFFAGDLATADIAALGGGPAPDGQITADDLIAFLAAFFAGCD